MKRLNKLKVTLPLLATAFATGLALQGSSASALANPAPSVALNSPGAQEFMAEEVESWTRSLESRRLSIRYQQQMNGGFVLRGTPSPAQRFNRGKLIACQTKPVGSTFAAIRNSCDVNNPIFIPLSLPGQDQVTPVPAGNYIVGFENTMSNGFVTIYPGRVSSIDLQRVAVPAGGQVKVFRDMTSNLEQAKVFFSTYTMNESLFSLAQWDFGDLYLRPFGIEEGARRINYRFCEGRLPELTTKGGRICKAWNQGSYMSVMEMFDFEPLQGRDKNGKYFVIQNSIGGYRQFEVLAPGRPFGYRLARLLVSKQTSSNQTSYVNVLPGKYMVEVTDSTGRASLSKVSVGDLTTNMGWLPAPSALKLDGKATSAAPPTTDVNGAVITDTSLSPEDDDGDYVNPNETCTSSKMWRTEKRAYCRSDATEGCDRRTAQLCEPTFDIP